MKLANIRYTICVAITLTAFYSCQKVIHVNLNNSSPRYVIEGNVTDQPGPYQVMITRSVNFDQDNIFPAVSGAVVAITDNTDGQTDTLTETTPGTYQTSVLTGIAGHKYSLYVNYQNNIFTASSTMPVPVTLDSLYAQQSGFRGDTYQAVPVYTDPVPKGNYYHFVEYVNDTETGAIYIRNDAIINGQTIKEPLGDMGGNGGKKLAHGDQVTVYLECIDSAIYQYYFGLQQSTNQNTASPANPVTDITGGCLGYFSAHTSSMKSTIVP